MEVFEAPTAQAPNSPNRASAVLALGCVIGGCLLLVVIVVITASINRARRAQLTLPMGETSIEVSADDVELDGHHVYYHPMPLPRARSVPADTALLHIHTGEFFSNRRPVTRPVTPEDLAGFHPTGGLYATVPIPLQQQIYLESRGHVVVPPPLAHAPADVVAACGRGIRAIHRRHAVWHPRVVSQQRNASVDTLPRYESPPPEYEEEMDLTDADVPVVPR